mgnify:CR=1 FL=1
MKQRTADVVSRAKVDHTYLQLTPEAARGVTVTFNVRGKASVFTSPAFKKSSIMLNEEYLALILLMKFQLNLFFLWFLGLFSGGAMAPRIVDNLKVSCKTPAAKEVREESGGGSHLGLRPAVAQVAAIRVAEIRVAAARVASARVAAACVGAAWVAAAQVVAVSAAVAAALAAGGVVVAAVAAG